MHHMRQENLPFVERSGEWPVASDGTEPVIKAGGTFSTAATVLAAFSRAERY